jgi:hypothetical protein
MWNAWPTDAEISDGSVTEGKASFITTVRPSVAVSDCTGASGLAVLSTVERVPLIFFQRSQLATTSCASTARPLTGAIVWKWALGLSLNVTLRPSGDASQPSARSPATSPLDGPPAPGLTMVSRLNTTAPSVPNQAPRR